MSEIYLRAKIHQRFTLKEKPGFCFQMSVKYKQNDIHFNDTFCVVSRGLFAFWLIWVFLWVFCCVGFVLVFF